MTEEHINRMVRVTGLLEEEPERCGSGHLCWQLNYGTAVTTFRTRDEDLVAGTCVTFVGPASSFNGNVQLEPFNPLWARRYQRGSELGEPAKSMKIAPLQCALCETISVRAVFPVRPPMHVHRAVSAVNLAFAYRGWEATVRRPSPSSVSLRVQKQRFRMEAQFG